MKKPTEMTDEQITKWLDKTNASATAANRYENMQRKYELVDRYELLKEEALKRNSWDKYCDERDFDSSHDGWDLFA